MNSRKISWRSVRCILMATAASAGLLSTESKVSGGQVFTVTANSGTGAGSLFSEIQAADAFGNGATINIQSGLGTINAGVLPDITVGVTINGETGNTISGQNQNRIFFVNAPGQSVVIESLTLSGGLAQGGVGGVGAGSGGGGAGLGGAAFINSGIVSFQSVSFVSNSAQGGAGGTYQPGGGGGGGGMGFAGGAGSDGFTFGGSFYLLGAGGGGGARTSAGGSASGQSAAGGGGAHGGVAGTSGGAINGGSAGSPDGGGGGGGVDGSAYNPEGNVFGGSGGNGNDFGGGGGGGSSINNSGAQGGYGGFGSGGGGGGDTDLGFGGNGGNGGFGGGSGGGGGSPNAAELGDSTGGAAGFGGGFGGDGNEGAGGGGAAFGAGVFVRSSNGASVSFSDSSFDAGTLTAGAGGNTALSGHGGAAGSAAGGALFLMGGNTTFSVSPGNTEIIAGTISQSVASSITVGGGGILSLTGNNAGSDPYSGGTIVTAGELSIPLDNELGAPSGALTLNGGALQIVGTADHSTVHTINLGGGGGGFDIAAAGNTFTVSQALSGNASMTKSGSGTLVLSGANTYTGSTTVNGGSLELAFPFNGSAGTLAASSTIAVNNGSTLELGDAGGQNNVLGSGLNAPNVSIPGISLNGGILTSFMDTTHNLGALSLAAGIIFGDPAPTPGFNDFTFNSPVTVDASTFSSSISSPGGIGLRIAIPFAVSAGPGNLVVTANLNDEPGGNSGGVTKNGVGTMILHGTDSYTLGTIVNAGTLILGSPGALPINTSLTVNGGTAQITNYLVGTRFLSQVSSLSLGGTSGAWMGQVDLTNTDLIVHHGDPTALTNQIHQGYNNGTWNGQGIISSVATSNTALGIELNDDGTGTNTPLMTKFDGQTVGDTDVLVKYTYFGDANLDGVVNSGDYLLIDNGFNAHLSGWRNGDFNYDGVVNGDDYTLIDNAFNTQGTASSAMGSAGPTELVASSVPEPGGLALTVMGGMGLARRRRVNRSEQK